MTPHGSSTVDVPFVRLQSIGAQVSGLHLVIIALSLIMTLGAWQFSRYQIETRTSARFEQTRDRVVDLLRNGMLKYEDALWAGVSAVESHGGDMSLEQWRDFARTLRIDVKYPGINGIGIIHFLDQADLPRYLARRNAERPGFAIYPDHPHDLKMPISFIVPETANKEAIGLDVAHEINRRTAALASRDLGKAQITGPITLVQDAGHTPGFLFYAPFYADVTAASPATREKRSAGAVYAPFVVSKLMNGLLAKERRNVHFSITDAETVIYDEHEADDALTDPDPMYAEQVMLELYGRNWMIDMRTNLAFRANSSYAQPWVILVGGLVIEALIIALIILMSRANIRAVDYANTVTAALKKESHKLAKRNEEMQQFTYIASHDLKTPIRGIAGLTEILREDLEPYLSDPDADPEIRKNLDRIEERANRMGELTRGIIDFARSGEAEPVNVPLPLAKTIEDMRIDFGLQNDALVLSSEVNAVHHDSFGLHRVLENLVSNAIKHHDNLKPMRVEVMVRRRDNRLEFTVRDNGPGIDPQYHQRIFEVFQTLRLNDEVESTGIGLAIVKKIVERHGGKVSLVSAPSDGATFRFDWPDPSASELQPLKEGLGHAAA